ncbi:alpha-tocopherol transfer protein-like [Arctopsyche grandis]|uniref:alpha-tocopherol transfer protein-like n=1 Tax=Arctopsyche grandis TaxID=121162 RepID=UPI00406D742B
MPSNRSEEEAESLAELAKRELRETPDVKLHALVFMKGWIRQNSDIVNVKTDDVFLLRFLRTKKYSLPMTQQMLLKWLNLRKCYPNMCKHLDCLETNTRDLIDNGYVYASPFRDEAGRRIVLYNAQKFDPMKYTCEDMARIHILTYEALLEDEENQIRGVVHVGDLRGLSASHISCWSPELFARMIRWGEQSMPLRHKEIHLLNVPFALKYVYDFAKSMISQKMGSRITLHNTMHSVYSSIPSRCLPKEYGGNMPMDEMIAKWKGELLHHRATIQSFDKMDILNTDGIKSSKRTADLNNNMELHYKGMSGSFRKLEID